MTDLAVTSTTESSVTLAFTEVDDGTGRPALYRVVFGTPDVTGPSASLVEEGSCAPPLEGVEVGARLICSVKGLSPGTPYEFAVVAYRETKTGERVYGSISPEATGHTRSEERGGQEGGPNEPPGFTRFAAHDLSCVPGTPRCDGEVGQWWVDPDGLDLISTVSQATGLLTGDVVEITFPSGLDDGFAPARFDGWGPSLSPEGGNDYRELYVSFWLRIRGEDFQNQTVGTKVFYVAYGSTGRQNHSFLLLVGTGRQQPMSSMSLDYRTTEMTESGEDARTGAGEHLANVTDRRVTVGDWHHVEVWYKVNEIRPTRADGEIKVWLDGVATHHLTGLRLRSDRNPKGLYHFQFTPVYGGDSGDIRTREDRWLVDNVYLSAPN